MEEQKKEILKSFIPKAVLLPLTQKAKQSLPTEEKLIPIRLLPFKIGRESRLGKNERGIFIKLRMINENSQPNNDIYLVDDGNQLEISKEHCEISIEDDSYILTDRNSSNGTILNGDTLSSKTTKLKDGDIIQMGSSKSEYKFQFITLDI